MRPLAVRVEILLAELMASRQWETLPPSWPETPGVPWGRSDEQPASTTAQAIAEKATRGRGERRGMAVEMRRLRAGRPRISVNRTGVHGRGLIQSNIIIGYMSVNLGRVNGFCR